MNRRAMLWGTAAAGAALWLPGCGGRKPSLTGTLSQELEDVIAWIDTSSSQGEALELAAEQLAAGLSPRTLLQGIFLAGIRTLRPKPFGSHYHAVLLIDAALQLSLDAAAADKHLPALWALDKFKSAQAAEAEPGWVLGAIDEGTLPRANDALQTLEAALVVYDAPLAASAVVALHRTAGANAVFEPLLANGPRRFNNLGHEMMFTVKGWHLLQALGREQAEPVLRTVIAGQTLDGAHATESFFTANQQRLATIPATWPQNQPSPAATEEVLTRLREATPEEASELAASLLRSGAAASSIWDGINLACAELMLRCNNPGQRIVAIHSVNASNALHEAFALTGSRSTQLMLLLQGAAWVPAARIEALRRDAKALRPELIDTLAPLAGTLDTAFAQSDATTAVQHLVGAFESGVTSNAYFSRARRYLFTRADEEHHYKLADAMGREVITLAPKWWGRYLATNAVHMPRDHNGESSAYTNSAAALKKVGLR